ncbi:MAG: hypothetical protein ACR2PU_03485 [Gammaproteobacteria bacterium]
MALDLFLPRISSWARRSFGRSGSSGQSKGSAGRQPKLTLNGDSAAELNKEDLRLLLVKAIKKLTEEPEEEATEEDADKDA